MITGPAVAAVLLMLATGWVLFRRLARLLSSGQEMPSDTELLLIGVLPAMALVGLLMTYLAFVHLFRVWIASALVVGVLLGFREDSRALARALVASALLSWRQIRLGNLFPLLAVLVGSAVLVTVLLLARIPAETIDVWAFHLPLAEGFIEQRGFAPHLIPNPFYSSQPLFFELLFATAMFAVDHYVAANAVNVAIYFGLMLLVASFARRARAAQALLVFLIMFWFQNFALAATEPMIDLPRACFSVGAFLFAYRYAMDFRRLDLFLSALLAGAAVAGKYTELTTPALIGVTLLPLMARRGTWRDLPFAAIAFLVVAAPWYIKNWVLTGNPIYPFVFGHPELSDTWMADYMRDLGRPFYPSDRGYSTSLLTLKGWGDFAVVFVRYFSILIPAALVNLIGLFLPRPRRWMLPLWSVLLFLIWYGMMFNSTRWAITAVLLLTASFLITLFWIGDRLVAIWERPTGRLGGILDGLKRRFDSWPVAASGAAALIILFGVVRLATHHGALVRPRWMPRDLAIALVNARGMERWLDDTRPGYVMYRFIGEHNFGHVLQPFDNGAVYYASVYNGGQPNNWVLPYTVLPLNRAELVDFIRGNDIHFFILPDDIGPLDTERLGSSHLDQAKATIAVLKPHARMIFNDNRGWSLYRLENWP